MKDSSGYNGESLEFLKKAKARVGDVLEVETEWGKVVGTVVPRYMASDDAHVVLKLKTGYNVGLLVSKLRRGRVVEKGESPKFSPPERPVAKEGLPKVLLLGTGGTIASRVDYRTGAVHPAVASADLHALVPELSDLASVTPEILFNVFSENIDPGHWAELAKRIAVAFEEGYRGVVVTHGTDTLGYTSAALSFALNGIPIPVVLTAAQRSSDRPSSDATLNLIGAVGVAASADFGGVFVAMHLNESDDSVAVHMGTRVRKDHTSRRDAFRSVGVPVVGVWRDGALDVESRPESHQTEVKFRPKPDFERSASLLKFYPSMPAQLVSSLRGFGIKALILEGTGLGHVSSEVTRAIAEFVKGGGFVGITSQCINGRVDLNVYDTGRDLMAAGALPLEDMLSETALVKAMWVLGNRPVGDLASSMVDNIAGEMTPRRFPDE